MTPRVCAISRCASDSPCHFCLTPLSLCPVYFNDTRMVGSKEKILIKIKSSKTHGWLLLNDATIQCRFLRSNILINDLPSTFHFEPRKLDFKDSHVDIS